MTARMNRRRFIAALGAAGYWLRADAASANRAADKPLTTLRFAGVGIGGKGSSDIDHAGELGEVVALCDIDEKNIAKKAEKWRDAKVYHDFRKMLDQSGKDIDAVIVSAPDHIHAPASVMAMAMGKHVYCQKPLTHSVFEARRMREVAKQYKVCTQMGNQGTASNGVRRAAEIVQAGVLGPVREVHVWTNRPVWPQSPTVKSRPPEAPVPAHVHWDEFIGPAPMRPYAVYPPNKKGEIKGAYHDFNWRGWWDFGTGALGDMACHTANMAFMALRLGFPKSIAASSEELNPETYPAWAHVVFEFPARGDMAPVTLHWYEGRKDGKLVLPPEELLAKLLKPKEKLAESGSILVGDKGTLFSPNDYGAEYRLVGDGVAEAAKAVPETLPRNGKGDLGMKQEWARAIREGKSEIAVSNFDYAGVMTEAVLLGNVAIRAGKKLDWDGDKFTFTNDKGADRFLHREYRAGWTL